MAGKTDCDESGTMWLVDRRFVRGWIEGGGTGKQVHTHIIQRRGQGGEQGIAVVYCMAASAAAMGGRVSAHHRITSHHHMSMACSWRELPPPSAAPPRGLMLLSSVVVAAAPGGDSGTSPPRGLRRMCRSGFPPKEGASRSKRPSASVAEVAAIAGERGRTAAFHLGSETRKVRPKVKKVKLPPTNLPQPPPPPTHTHPCTHLGCLYAPSARQLVAYAPHAPPPGCAPHRRHPIGRSSARP